MYNLYVDLQYMVLERVPGKSLTSVARVNRFCREYIDNNIHRMRLIACNRLIIIFSNITKSSICSIARVCLHRMFAEFLSSPTFVLKVADPHRFKFYYPSDLNKLCKYLPTDQLEFTTVGDISSYDIVDRLAKYIPDWWIDQVGEIRCKIKEVIFCCFISKFRHFSEVVFNPILPKSNENRIADALKIVRSSQQIDRFCFLSTDGFDRTVFQAIVDKSKVNPTEFPIVCPLMPLYFKTFLFFMENVSFTEMESHTLKASIVVSQEGWNRWITAYTRGDHPKPTELEDGYFHYRFRYRAMEFEAQIMLITPPSIGV